MSEVLSAFGVAVSVVFVAELGDKSQLLTLAFAARYRWPVVLAGVSIATALLMAVSVSIGGLAGAVLPRRAIEIVAGVVFLGFAAWTLWGSEDDDSEDAGTSTRGALRTVVTAFAVAELGDKTMLATVALASTRSWLGIWAGATVGMVAANSLALVLGDQVGARLPQQAIRYGAAALFVVFGVLLLAGVGNAAGT